MSRPRLSAANRSRRRCCRTNLCRWWRPSIRRPFLVADIGGTNVRFALVDPGPARIRDVVSLRCADFDGPLEAAQAYLRQSALSAGAVKRAAFAVAAAVDGDTVKLTNSVWTFQRSQLERLLDLDELAIFNDFEALARGLPGLAASDFRLIGSIPPSLSQSMVVIGPGTGLGVAGMIPSRHGWIAVPGEGGHATLSASDDFEAEILKAARREYGHVSAERLLSGIGLPVLLRAVCAVQGTTAVDLPAERISAEALSDPQCRITMEVFFAFLGGFAGNLALSFGARGGVFIGGGIVPQLQDLLARSRFRERFESKGRFQAYLAGIGTAILTAPQVALRGLACALENADPG